MQTIFNALLSFACLPFILAAPLWSSTTSSPCAGVCTNLGKKTVSLGGYSLCKDSSYPGFAGYVRANSCWKKGGPTTSYNCLCDDTSSPGLFWTVASKRCREVCKIPMPSYEDLICYATDARVFGREVTYNSIGSVCEYATSSNNNVRTHRYDCLCQKGSTPTSRPTRRPTFQITPASAEWTSVASVPCTTACANMGKTAVVTTSGQAVCQSGDVVGSIFTGSSGTLDQRTKCFFDSGGSWGAVRESGNFSCLCDNSLMPTLEWKTGHSVACWAVCNDRDQKARGSSGRSVCSGKDGPGWQWVNQYCFDRVNRGTTYDCLCKKENLPVSHPTPSPTFSSNCDDICGRESRNSVKIGDYSVCRVGKQYTGFIWTSSGFNKKPDTVSPDARRKCWYSDGSSATRSANFECLCEPKIQPSFSWKSAQEQSCSSVCGGSAASASSTRDICATRISRQAPELIGSSAKQFSPCEFSQYWTSEPLSAITTKCLCRNSLTPLVNGGWVRYVSTTPKPTSTGKSGKGGSEHGGSGHGGSTNDGGSGNGKVGWAIAISIVPSYLCCIPIGIFCYLKSKREKDQMVYRRVVE